MGEGLVFPPQQSFAPQARRSEMTPLKPVAAAQDALEALTAAEASLRDAATITGDARRRITIGAVMIFGSLLFLATLA